MKPSTQHVTHVYHTGDPIAIGACNGLASSCAIAGYAMESRCHLGKIIKYDTVSKLNWSVDIRTHSIRNVVEHILSKDWPVPEAKEEVDCVVRYPCYLMKFSYD
jgi:lipase ATG15